MKNLVVYLGLRFASFTYSTASLISTSANRELDVSQIEGHLFDAPQHTTIPLPSELEVGITSTHENNVNSLRASVGELPGTSETGLENQLNNGQMTPKKPTRVWADGCFDLFHYGHANALRQSRGRGDFLVAGTHSDAEISHNKGPPVLSQDVRVELLKACRWVDEVVPNAPYNTAVGFLKSHNINLVAHGDDVTTDANGEDTYRFVKEAGMYVEFKRTTGVSTTDAIGRILSLYKPADLKSSVVPDPDPVFDLGIKFELLQAFATNPPSFSISHPIQPDITKIDFDGESDLAADNAELPSDRLETKHQVVCTSAINGHVVYVHGAFDLFSVQDLNYLKKLSESGRVKVIVGVWGGDDVRTKLGKESILSFQERVLGVLQCRYVSGVVVPAVRPDKLPFEQLASYFTAYSAEDTINSILNRKELFLKRQIRKSGKAALEKELEQTQ